MHTTKVAGARIYEQPMPVNRGVGTVAEGNRSKTGDDRMKFEIKKERLEKHLKEVEGQVYYVRMTQLIFDAGADPVLVPGTIGQISNMHGGGVIDNPQDYPGAMLAFRADFYALKSNNQKYIEDLNLDDANGDGNPDSLGKPLFSRNIAVRR